MKKISYNNHGDTNCNMSASALSLDDRFSQLIKAAVKPQLISLQRTLLKEIHQLKTELRQSIQEIKAEGQKSIVSEANESILSFKNNSPVNPPRKRRCEEGSTKGAEMPAINITPRLPAVSDVNEDPEPPQNEPLKRKTLVVVKRAPRMTSPKDKSNLCSRNPQKSVLDIRAKTKEQEVQLTAQEVEDIAKSQDVTPGLTMRGEAISDISAVIPKEFNVTVAVEFINHLDVTLTDPQCWLDSGSVYGLVPSVLEKATKESFSFHDNNYKEDGVNGLFSYKISSTNLRLAISFGSDNSGTTLLGIAFTPEDVSAGEELDDYMWNVVKQDEMRSDIKCANWSSEVKCLIVKMKNLRARVTMTSGPKAIMQVTVLKTCSSERADLEEKLVAIILKGKISSKQPPPSPACKRGNVIEITNLLKVCLQDAERYVPNNSPQQDFLPDIIPEFTRVSFSTLDLKNSEEIFSYRIDTTDLRLAITFCTKSGENSFGIAFIPDDVPTDTELISSMTKLGEWVTRPDRKLGLAKNGEQVIEVRNMRAKVTMTQEPQVMLMVIISSF
ncbi:unnamed protein product [Allacma fusca]|uniref:Uncharacterized protein n=1 Tax=Allacma fusca TaxID=39272 RepID=A0A8J2PJB3_9HEXA|nr:unnamed protein product [Allacma fusca]